MNTECHPTPIKKRDFFNEVPKKVFLSSKEIMVFSPFFFLQQKQPDELGIVHVLNWGTGCTAGMRNGVSPRHSWDAQSRLILDPRMLATPVLGQPTMEWKPHTALVLLWFLHSRQRGNHCWPHTLFCGPQWPLPEKPPRSVLSWFQTPTLIS